MCPIMHTRTRTPQGHTASVELYTHVTRACLLPGHVNWEQAMYAYNLMQRYGVVPDTHYYATLVAIAGASDHLPQVRVRTCDAMFASRCLNVPIRALCGL
jgi:hypothetical protein